MKKNIKGITLIALVITIIVLLILAAVTINLVIGENGIFSKARNAKEQVNYASAKETLELSLLKIKQECIQKEQNYTLDLIADELGKTTEETIEIMQYYGLSAKVNSNANSVPANIDGIVVIVKEYPKYKFLIGTKEDSSVGIEGVLITSSNSPAKKDFKNIDDFEKQDLGVVAQESEPKITVLKQSDYGKLTDYKSKGTNEKNLLWRIFYYDDNYIYLISETSTGGVPLTNTSYSLTNYPNGASVSQVGKDLSPVLTNDGRYFDKNVSWDSVRIMAYLTDTSENGPWENYKDSDGKALYAIGSPTYELFFASASKEFDLNNVNYIATSYGLRNYEFGVDDRCNGIYNKPIFLASPSYSNAYEGQIMTYLSSSNVTYSKMGWSAANFRPVVCIRKDNFDFKIIEEDE